MIHDEALVARSDKEPTGLVAVPVSPISREEAEDLLGYVLSQLDVKDATRAVYKYGMRDFLRWLDGRGLHRTVVVQYKQALRGRKDLSTGTKNLYLSAVRVMMTHLHRAGVIPHDMGTGVRGFKVGRAHKKEAITDEQVNRVFAYCAKHDDRRMTAIFSLLYFQGLRQHEVLTVRVEDFDVSTRTLMIHGKSRDEQERIDLHPRAVEVIRWYIETAALRSGYLFYSRRSTGNHISRIQLGRLIRDVHEACDVRNTGHAWRKVFTSKLIDSGMDLLSVSAFTRHKSIEMLKVYYDRLEKKKKLPTYYATFDSRVVTLS